MFYPLLELLIVSENFQELPTIILQNLSQGQQLRSGIVDNIFLYQFLRGNVL